MIPKLTGVLIVAGCLKQQHIVGNTEVEQALSLHWASHDEAQMQPVNGGIYVTNKQCGHEPTESADVQKWLNTLWQSDMVMENASFSVCFTLRV